MSTRLTRERARIDHRHVVEPDDRAEKLHGAESEQQADGGAERGQARRLLDDEPGHGARGRAEGHPDANLARPLAERVDQHAVEPRDAEGERHAAEERPDPRGGAQREPSEARRFVHREDVERQRIAVDALQHVLERIHPDAGRRQPHQQHRCVRSGRSGGNIEVGGIVSLIDEAVHDVGGHADDGQKPRAGRFIVRSLPQQTSPYPPPSFAPRVIRW